MTISATLVDVHQRTLSPVILSLMGGIIESITPCESAGAGFLLPGLVDSHIHIESSLLTPSRLSELIVPRGTIAVVADPHEIANVCGIEGVEYMMADAEGALNKVFFAAPSCVPATPFETAGASFGVSETRFLLEKERVVSLAEMMNFPGVIHDDAGVLAKMDAAKRVGKPVDGHAPGLSGADLSKYVAAGVSTDHECFSISEAQEKISLGMMIQIREGSAAKNFDTLIPLIATHPGSILFCTDDCHPDELLRHGHIDKFLRQGVALGYDLFDLVRAASVNAINFYNLPVGQLRVGDRADFILVDNLRDFTVLETYVDGVAVFENKRVKSVGKGSAPVNNFTAEPITEDDILLQAIPSKRIRVIQAHDGSLVTDELFLVPKLFQGLVVSDMEDDILKLVVINRYQTNKPQVGFIRGFKLQSGALGGSVAHDSHNIILVGTNDQDMVALANAIIKVKGGMGSCDGGVVDLLDLPIAGLMSNRHGNEVAVDYERLNGNAKQMGCKLFAPFMTLAFMSLLVIPDLKLGDKGLFDSKHFCFVDLFVD